MKPISKRAWQKALSEVITDPEILCKHLDLTLNQTEKDYFKKNVLSFPLRVTYSFLNCIQKGNRFDPVLLQILPLPIEEENHSDFKEDPLSETEFNPIPGLLHKYPSRVLLTLTSACAIHCRYCFRRHFPYKDNRMEKSHDGILRYIESHPEVNEVILSGGDPLSAPDSVLEQLSSQLKTLENIRYFRIHTRMPVVLPERIDESFLSWIGTLPWKLVMVLHINHPQEVSEALIKVVSDLKKQGVTVLNQSVLMKNVNDDVCVLEQLSHTLFSAGILPYYLHQLDKVAGAHHFWVDPIRGAQLYKALSERLSGYLLPKWVTEIPNELSKSLLIV